MTQATWTAVDDYFIESTVPEAAELDWLLQENAAAGLPAIDVSPSQGKLLQILVAICGAGRVLEIGTLGGYSTTWLARALPERAEIVTLEVDPDHAETARANFQRAGIDAMIDLRVGPALESLAALEHEDGAPFDFVFVDADKPNNPNYFDHCLKLTRPGSVIVFDNVVREGNVIHADSDDDRVQGVRRLFERVAAEPRVCATGIQTVGQKGYDGFLILRVVS